MLDVRRKQNIAKRVVALGMAFLCTFTSLNIVMPLKAQAANKLTIKAARSLAIQNSTEYEGAEDKIMAKQAAYDSASSRQSPILPRLLNLPISPLLSHMR